MEETGSQERNGFSPHLHNIRLDVLNNFGTPVHEQKTPARPSKQAKTVKTPEYFSQFLRKNNIRTIEQPILGSLRVPLHFPRSEVRSATRSLVDTSVWTPNGGV
jgi:hypothetical protein